MNNTTELYDQFIVPSYDRIPLNVSYGCGSWLWSEDGKKYLDFTSGIAVSVLGHAHPIIIDAMNQQAKKIIHTSNIFFTRPQAELAEFLVRNIIEISGKIFFCNSGAEANEGMYKLARKFGSLTGGRYEIITFSSSFHGRTLAGISATGQAKVKHGFEPLVPGFIQVEFNNINAVKAAIQEKTVAILLEPIQGESGIHQVKPSFLRELHQLCHENNLLLLFDEIQAGLGRTGYWCSWKNIVSDIQPDAVSWAKGLAGGFPLGAFWVNGNRQVDYSTVLSDILGIGTHATTYGGNPVTTAVALAILSFIDRERILDHVKTIGHFIIESIKKMQLSIIQEVRGAGLMIGIELKNSLSYLLPAKYFVNQLFNAGLLTVSTGTHTIRLLPPLNITQSEAQIALDMIYTTFLSKNI